MSDTKDTLSRIEILLYQEAANDLEIERQGKPASVGEMQKRFPVEYRTARELVLRMAQDIPLMGLSMKQGEKISEMIHSEDEGLDSIQEILNMQPVNALTLVHLVRLERENAAKLELKLRAQKGAEAHHREHRNNAEKMRAIWAEGKYTSRDRCAIEECEALGMSYDTARRALRRTPQPS
jgi:hypothetical protein